MQFKDITTYRQGEADRIPRILRSVIDGWLSVTVHRHIYYPSDQWLLSVPQLLFQNRELQSKDIDAAKSEAISLVFARLQSALASLEPKP